MERFITIDHPTAAGRQPLPGEKAWIFTLANDRVLHTGRAGRALLRRHLLAVPQVAPHAVPLYLSLDDGTTLQLRLSKDECEEVRTMLIEEMRDDEMAEEV